MFGRSAIDGSSRVGEERRGEHGMVSLPLGGFRVGGKMCAVYARERNANSGETLRV
jgi:hypothetical protein